MSAKSMLSWSSSAWGGGVLDAEEEFVLEVSGRSG